MCNMCMPEAGESQKALLNSLRLELQTAAHFPVCLAHMFGNETQVCAHS